MSDLWRFFCLVFVFLPLETKTKKSQGFECDVVLLNPLLCLCNLYQWSHSWNSVNQLHQIVWTIKWRTTNEKAERMRGKRAKKHVNLPKFLTNIQFLGMIVNLWACHRIKEYTQQSIWLNRRRTVWHWRPLNGFKQHTYNVVECTTFLSTLHCKRGTNKRENCFSAIKAIIKCSSFAKRTINQDICDVQCSRRSLLKSISFVLFLIFVFFVVVAVCLRSLRYHQVSLMHWKTSD